MNLAFMKNKQVDNGAHFHIFSDVNISGFFSRVDLGSCTF